MNKSFGWCVLVSLAAAFCLAACGGSSGSDSGGNSVSGGGAATKGSTIFPHDLVVTSPFAISAAAKGISIGAKSFDILLSVDAAGEDYASKKEELESKLTATSTDACGFNLLLFASAGGAVNCYGPGVSYVNHPDVVAGQSANGDSGGGDSGIWDELNNNEEACAAAQTNLLVSQISAAVDTAVNSFASMVCVINATGLTVPAAGGAPLDLASTLQSVLETNGIKALTISSAKLEHQASDADGHDVYFFTLTGTATNSGDTRGITLYLKHIPLDATNTTYKGKLSFAFTDDSGRDPGNCMDTNTVGSATTESLVEAGSILYHKDSETNLTYRLQSGKFCDSSHTPLDTSHDYDIDPTDSASASNPTGYANGFKYYLFNMNPQDGTGSFAFAWVAGSGAEDSRTLDITLSNLEGGGKGGCAYFGYGPPVSFAGAHLGDINGFICNWSMPGANHTMHNLVERQCVSYDNASMKYLTDNNLGTLAIKYAPTNSCDTDAGNGFTYHSHSSTEAQPATNDRYTDSIKVTNELIGITDKHFTLSAVPEDVY